MKIDTIQHAGQAAEILLVEDNPGDAILTQKAFKRAKISSNITIANDGEQAMKILRREAPHAGAPSPDLILMDLNLPKKSGKDVLREIKTDAALKRIPVIILTSSHAELDVVKAYDLHANSYIIKPDNLEKFAEIVAAIEGYWFTVVVLPFEEKIKP